MIKHYCKSVFISAVMMALMVLSGCVSESVVMEKPSEPCDQAKTHIRQGMAYSGQRDFKNSEREFMSAIRLCPSSSEAHANLGVAYIQMGDNNKAERSLKTAVNLNPNDADAWYNLAVIYSINMKLDLALEAMDTALGKGFNNIEALRNDPDLNNVRRDPEYSKTLERHRVFL